VKTKQILQHIVMALRTVANSRMSDIDKRDCTFSLKRASELLTEEAIEEINLVATMKKIVLKRKK